MEQFYNRPNECKKLQFIHTVNGDGSKTAKIIKKAMLTTLTLIQAMLVWLTLPFYDFCGFRSIADIARRASAVTSR